MATGFDTSGKQVGVASAFGFSLRLVASVGLACFLLSSACLVALSAAGERCPGVEKQSPKFKLWNPGPPGRVIHAWVYFSDKGPAPGPAEAPSSEGAPSREIQDLRDPGIRRWEDAPVSELHLARVRDSGVKLRNVSRWLNAASVSGTSEQLFSLSERPFVRLVTQVRRFSRGREPDVPAREAMEAQGFSGPDRLTANEKTGMAISDEVRFHGVAWHELDQIGVTTLHRLGYTGSGVRIAMFDSGFRPDHKALRSRQIVAQRDFVFHRPNVYDNLHDDPESWQHGTATWSIVGGYDPGNFVGGGFEAEFVLCRTEDDRAEYPAEEDNYVAALEWADSLGVRVVSVSLAYTLFDGHVGYTPRQRDGDTEAVTRAVDIAVSRGIAVINAAGNSGPGVSTIEGPSDADSVIAVGAVDSLGKVTSFSSRGPTSDGRIKPEVMARGIESAVANSDNNGYKRWAGTSFAAPTVAAAAALLMEAHPHWNGARLRQALIATASTATHPDNTYGYGLVNSVAALYDDPDITPPALPPPFSLISPTSGDTLDRDSVTLVWQHSSSHLAASPSRYFVLMSRVADFGEPVQFELSDTLLHVPGAGLTGGARYFWKVVAQSATGRQRACYFGATFVVRLPVPVRAAIDDSRSVPHLLLSPNPSRGGTSIAIKGFGEADGSGSLTARVAIFDAVGRIVRQMSVDLPPNEREACRAWWDGRDVRGRHVPSGVYLCVATVGGLSARTKLLVQR